MTSKAKHSVKRYAKQLAETYKFKDTDRLHQILVEGQAAFQARITQQRNFSRLPPDKAVPVNIEWQSTAKLLARAIDGLIDLSNDEGFFELLVDADVDPELEGVIGRLTDIRAFLVPLKEDVKWRTTSPIRSWVSRLAEYWELEKGSRVTKYFGPAENGVKRPVKKHTSSQFIFDVIEHFEPSYVKGVFHALTEIIAKRSSR